MVAAVLSSACASTPRHAALDALDADLEKAMTEAKVPGLSCAIVRDGEVLWTGAYGFAYVEEHVPVREDTLFHLASVSKIVSACAILQLVERGVLDLDADVSTYVPFEVRHPLFPDVPITLRHLLTHTSGIRDRYPLLDEMYVEGDSPTTLAGFLPAYLVPGGAHYDAERNFSGEAPGARHDYSNVAFTLAAYVAEAAVEVPFDTWSQESLLEPLGINDARWRMADLDPADVALPYVWDEELLVLRRHHHQGYPDYPAGTLRMSAPSLGRFLAMVIGDGEVDGVRVLEVASVAELERVQFPSANGSQALGFFYEDIGGERVLGHDGGDPGVSAVCGYRVRDGVGAVVLMNGDPLGRRVPERIVERLFEAADALPRDRRG